MTSSSVGLARGILRNAGALFLVGLFAKGMGLVIAILIARFLGPGAMGLFALLFSVAMLLETFISIGMSDSLVRDAAARPHSTGSLYRHASRLVLGISVLPAIGLAAWALSNGVDADMRNSLLVVAAGAPVSGVFVVSQAVLQGMERVLFLTWVTFLARVASLIWLALALYRGAGVEAAFVSRVIFQVLCIIAFYVVLRRQPVDESIDVNPGRLVAVSLPFALNQFFRDMSLRVPSLVLPATLGLAASGIFDTANRMRSTVGMTMSAAIVGMMPSFARTFGEPSQESHRLVGFSVKYMCLAMAALATVIALCAEWLIRLMFGPGFVDASLPLQILAWAQVLVAVDAVLQQAILARGRPYNAVKHSAAGVIGQFVLILLLAGSAGLPGVACAVLLASGLSLLLDLRFVVRGVTAIPLYQFVVAPLTAAGIVAAALLVTQDWSFWPRLAVVGGGWTLVVLLFRLFPKEELDFIRQLAPRSLSRRGLGK